MIYVDGSQRLPFTNTVLLLTWKYSGRSIMVWAAILWKSSGPMNGPFRSLLILQPTSTRAIFQYQVHPVVQTFFPDDVLLLLFKGWWAPGLCQASSIASPITRFKHHLVLMGNSGTQTAKQISTTFIPHSIGGFLS